MAAPATSLSTWHAENACRWAGEGTCSISSLLTPTMISLSKKCEVGIFHTSFAVCCEETQNRAHTHTHTHTRTYTHQPGYELACSEKEVCDVDVLHTGQRGARLAGGVRSFLGSSDPAAFPWECGEKTSPYSDSSK